MSPGDGVSVSIDVEVEPDLVFAVFTEEIDAWWGRGPRFRFLAPYQGTMVLEPGVGVTVTHRGWDGVPAGHPARHGLGDREFILMKGQ